MADKTMAASKEEVASTQPVLIQAKLWVGSSRDPLEQDADRVAEQVVNKIQTPATTTASSVANKAAVLNTSLNSLPARKLTAASMSTASPAKPKTTKAASKTKPGSSRSHVGTKNVVQRQAETEQEEETEHRESDLTVQRKPETAVPRSSSSPRSASRNQHVFGQPLNQHLGRRIQSATLQRGRPLATTIRSQIETAMRVDLSHVRIHQDAEAASLSNSLRARAFTIGQHVFFGQNQYAPHTRTGLHLLSHELTHVQQQLGPQCIARDGEDIFADREVPSSAIAVGLFGMDFHPQDNSTYSGGPTRFEAMAVVLKRLLGTQYRRGIEQRVYAELARQQVSGTGRFSATEVAEAGAEIDGPLHVDIRASNKLITILEDPGFNFEVQLSTEERQRLAMGLTAVELWPEIQPHMPAWYSEWMFGQELNQQGVLLRQYHAAAQPSPGATDAARQIALGQLLAVVWPPVHLLERIREDMSIAHLNVEEGDDSERDTRVHALAMYMILWDLTAEQLSALQNPPPAVAIADGERQARIMSFMNHARTQPQFLEAGRAATAEGHSARIQVLARFARFFVRSGRAAQRTGEIMDHPARANAPAWSANMTVSPQLLPPLYSAALETDLSFTMNLHFNHFTDAFAIYHYQWERIRIPDPPQNDSDTQQAVPDVEQMAGQRPDMGEVWDTRMRRTHRYNATDMERVRQMTGVSFGTSAHDLVEINNVLRITGTVLRYGIERITQPRHVKPIVFPAAGMYVIRCRAIPVLDGDEELVRQPSVVYQPVIAQDPDQMAVEQVEGSARTQFQARLRIAEIQSLLSAPFPPENATDLLAEMQYLQSILMTPHQRLVRNSNDLAAQIRTIEERMHIRAQIRGLMAAPEESRDTEQIDRHRARLRAIGGPGHDWEDARVLRRLRSQHETAVEMLGTRASRVQGEQGVPMELMATFVSDLGHTITLALEVYDRGPDGTNRSVFISDLTTPNSGIGLGDISHSNPASDEALQQAVHTALINLLESSSDYGRGRVAYRVGSSIHHMRIEAGTGRLLMEALEGASMVISIGAIAAAPFTAGASLYILLPVGLIGAAPSVYRLYNRYEADTLRFDLETVMDVVNIVGGIVGLAQVATPLRLVHLGRVLMIMGIGADGAGILLMGAGVVAQIAQLQNLPEGERAAQLLMILGNAMVQMGIMAGGMLAHAQYQGRRPGGTAGDESPSFHPPRERADAASGSTTPHPDAAGGTAVDTPHGQRTMAGTGGPPEAGGAAAPTRPATDAHSPQRLLELLDTGVDRSRAPAPRGGDVTNPPPAGSFGDPVRTAEAAHALYNDALAVSNGREVAIYHDPESGQFRVRIGTEGGVSAPAAGWNAVVHFHPNPGNVLTYRLPAPADFNGLIMCFMAEGGHVREFVEFDIPGVGRGRTEFGVQSGQAEPFYVRIHYPDGTSRTVRFANDGAYHMYWGERTTFVDPASPAYRDMIRDIQQFLRNRDPGSNSGSGSENGSSSGPMRPTGERTMAGSGAPAVAGSASHRLQDGQGQLTAEGIAFLRDRYRTARDGRQRIPLADLSDAQLQQRFQNSPGWLEAVVLAEVRSTWLGRGSDVDFVMTNSRQDFRQIANRLQQAIDAGSTGHSIHDPILSWSARDFILKMVRQNDPVLKPLFDALQNHPDPQIWRRWHQFKYSTRSGDMSGFFLGEVRAKRPDVVEVLLSQNEVHVTDVTFAVGDPIHNFKTAFYQVVMERLINVGTVTATDYRAPLQQAPVGP